MRIILNVKYRKGRVEIETKQDYSSSDKVVERNVGQSLFDALNETIKKLTGE